MMAPSSNGIAPALQGCATGALLALLLVPLGVQAQPREGRSIDAAIGYALSSPSDGSDGSDLTGTGLMVKAEYVFGWYSFFGARLYAGTLMTWPDNLDETEARCATRDQQCDVSAKISLLGAKARFAAPIPWVAPFLDVGVGASFGFLETHTPERETHAHGATVHIPFALGVALGGDHSCELAMVYYSHPRADQVNGGFTIGVSIPLGPL